MQGAAHAALVAVVAVLDDITRLSELLRSAYWPRKSSAESTGQLERDHARSIPRLR
jgi:hypothetical protein